MRKAAPHICAQLLVGHMTGNNSQVLILRTSASNFFGHTDSQTHGFTDSHMDKRAFYLRLLLFICYLYIVSFYHCNCFVVLSYFLVIIVAVIVYFCSFYLFKITTIMETSWG